MKNTHQKEWLMMELMEVEDEEEGGVDALVVIPMEMKEEEVEARLEKWWWLPWCCLLYTSPSPRDS